jgi:hypothetical protein
MRNNLVQTVKELAKKLCNHFTCGFYIQSSPFLDVFIKIGNRARTGTSVLAWDGENTEKALLRNHYKFKP